MLNKFLGIGNLTADPEVRTTSGGKSITTFTLAVNLDKEDKNPLFIDVQTWEKLADVCAKYLAKGRRVLIEGRLLISRWEDGDGNKRQKHYVNAQTVKFLNDGKGDGAQPSSSSDQSIDPEPSVDENEDPPF